MAPSSRGKGIVGYNVQTAIDTENHLIVAHEVVNQGYAREQLTSMAERASVGGSSRTRLYGRFAEIRGGPVTGRLWP